MLAIAAFLALSAPAQLVPAASAPQEVVVGETAAARSARAWLELVDAGDWQDSFLATAASFQSQNTLAGWRSASEQARVPLGAAIARRADSVHQVPAPPNGYVMVRFATRFANKPDAVESVSLVREGGALRVAGYYID